MSSGFVHLNLHSDRSLFVGLVKPSELAGWSKDHGCKAMAFTDHNNISIAVQQNKICRHYGLKPIFGMEISVAPDKTLKDRGSKNLVLLAKNKQGFDNLVKLTTLANMYFYYWPRVDIDDIYKYADGLIALTACQNGLTAGSFIAGGKEGLWQEYAILREIFWDDLYLEIQPAQKEIQRVYNEACRAVAEENDIKLVATGDPHYFAPEDRDFHRSFMSLKIMGGRDSEWDYPFKGPYHVRTRDEMDEQFADLHGYDINMVPTFKAALDRPDEIIEKIELFDISEGTKIPKFR